MKQLRTDGESVRRVDPRRHRETRVEERSVSHMYVIRIYANNRS
jgi:hypothetical protein